MRFNQVASLDTYRVNATSLFPTDGTWMHIAATYDGATIRLYINGIEEGSLVASITIATNDLPLAIGAQSDGIRFFQGALDQVRVYNRALSADDRRPGGRVAPAHGIDLHRILKPKPATTTTDEKPQSKVWRYAGAWWSGLPHRWRGWRQLRRDVVVEAGRHEWIDVLKLSTRTDTKADVKVAGNVIHALLYNDPNTQLASAQYNAGTGFYEAWSAADRAVEHQSA